jgi:amidase/aspartyl-tRNA(Asn)/glutamyl-tRNA(Gln) amidotransferase subunit A
MAHGGESVFVSAIEMSRLFRSGELSPVEALEAQFARIAAINPAINAYVELFHEPARAAARAAEEAWRAGTAGPLAGLPVSIKDLVATVEGRTTYGSRAFRDFRPGCDAVTVQRLRRAGAVITGKTNTPEFGLRPTTDNAFHGPTRNPWDLERHAGGSSGGAAAAVATGLGALAIGTDGGGSCRIPASCCGVVGLRPSRGRITPAPLAREGWAGLSTQGPIARTVRDAALLLDVIAGAELGDPYEATPPATSFLAAAERPPQGLRIGWAVSGSAPVEPAVAQAVTQALATFKHLGHRLVDRAPDLSGLEEPFQVIVQVNTAARPVPDAELAHLEANTLQLRQDGLRLAAVEYVRAVDAARLGAARVAEAWREIDVFVSPTLSSLPQSHGWPADFDTTWRAYMDFIQFTFPFNLTGQPAISIPCGRDAAGRPIGLQIVGRLNDEATVLGLAAAFEDAQPWTERWPEIATGPAAR